MDDDVFVNVDHLLNLVSGLNPIQALFMGQAGQGRPDERGKLFFAEGENFCMGGVGMLMSRPLIKQFVTKIDTCMGNLKTGHEDVEVGRCVTLATGKTCAAAKELRQLFYHSAGGEDGRGVEIQPDSINPGILNEAITIHPVKSPKNMEKMGSVIRAKKRLELLTEAKKLEFDLNILKGSKRKDYDNLADLPPGNGTWNFIFQNIVYSENQAPRSISKPLQKSINKIVYQVVGKINKDAREKGRTIEYRDLYYVYVNHDPVYGNSYILDILLVYKKFTGKQMTVKVRRHVFVREVLVNLHVKQITDSDSNLPSSMPAVVASDTPSYYVDGRRPITVLFTVAGDNKISAVQRFFKDFEREVLLKMDPVKLVIVVFRENVHDNRIFALINSLVKSLEKDYPGVSLTVVEKTAMFSRGVGLTIGLNACDDDDLIFIVDVDISFNSIALENVRRFTVEGQSVYFPIIFSEFRDGGGFWRSFGYGIMSGYKKDIVSAGGYDVAIQGWGKEDVDLYEKLLKSEIHVIRGTDTHILHKYHKVRAHNHLCRNMIFNNYCFINPVDLIITAKLGIML